MSDNKSKRGKPDSDLFNKNETYEVRYMVDKLAGQFPDASKVQVKKAVLESAAIKQFHESRKMIENSAKLKLKNL